MKWAVLKKDSKPEIIQIKAYARTIDSIITKDDLLRFIHKKTSKGVYPKNHNLEGPFNFEDNIYYVSYYSYENASKKFKKEDVWFINLKKKIEIVDNVVILKCDKICDIIVKSITKDINLENKFLEKICKFESNNIEEVNTNKLNIDRVEDEEDEDEDEDENELIEEDDGDPEEDLVYCDDEQQEIIVKKKSKKKSVTYEDIDEKENILNLNENVAIPDDLDIIVSSDILEYDNYDYESTIIPKSVLNNNI